MLECLSDGTKKAIVVVGVLVIIFLKVYGLISGKTTFFFVVALAVVGIITEPTLLASEPCVKSGTP